MIQPTARARRQRQTDPIFFSSRTEMLRTRLLWSTLGFSVTGAAIAHFVWRDLYADRLALSSHTMQKFRDLEARVSNLESNPARVDG